MRQLTTLALSLSLSASFGQWAIGAHIGVADDHTEGTNTPSLGLQLEHRFSDSSRFSFRLSADRIGMTHRAYQFTTYDAEMHRTGLAHELIERDRVAAILETRYALTETQCTNGYYRGAYAIGGLMWLGTNTSATRWTTDTLQVNGPIQRNNTFATSLRLRMGAGAQWSFAWGALFGEVLMTAGDESDTSGHQVLLTSLGLQAGYRYVFTRKA